MAIFLFFGHPVQLKHPFISLVYPFMKKKDLSMINIKEAKLFRRAKILINHSENALQWLPFM